MADIEYRIKEDSFLAKLAAKKLKKDNMAMVFGKTIHLYGAAKEEFLGNERWLKHELCHVRQYKEHGHILFLFKYLIESIRHGYYNNKYEAEARNAENNIE